MSLLPGLYDLLITESVARSLASADGLRSEITSISPEDLPDRLASALGDQLRAILADVEEQPERGIGQLSLVNALLVHVRTLARSRPETVDPVAEPAVLRAVHAAETPPSLPETGLAAPWLFTAGRGSPALLAELRREAAECDQIDILVSFITLSGIRKLIDILRSVTAADAAGHGRTPIRVLTTTYMGVTEMAALDQLAALNGCEVRISLDRRRSRLHAKAWIFHRRTGFGSAYVGSANLSHVALAAGLEWTVKFTERGQAALYDRAKAHFDTLWLDEEFTQYRPNDADLRAAVGAALSYERGGAAQVDGALATTFFDLQSKPYQRDMLEQLAREREHGRTRNLVVAATGTGKTVVAAFDYRATVDKLGGQRPRLLFVAHREQILQQALATYQHVLRDGSFGDLLAGGREPRSYDHLFASIDSLTRRGTVETLGPAYWHTVVIDECHALPRIALIDWQQRSSRRSCSVSPRRPNAQTVGPSAPISSSGPTARRAPPVTCGWTPRPAFGGRCSMTPRRAYARQGRRVKEWAARLRRLHSTRHRDPAVIPLL